MESFGLTVSFSLYGDLLGITGNIETVAEDESEEDEEFEEVEEPEVDEDFADLDSF